MTMSKKFETRAFAGIELREAPKDSPFIATLAGYAARFNSDSSPIMNEQRKRPFIERIAPGAFTESLAEQRESGDEILAFWSHDHTRPLGRRGKNLRLEQDDTGLRFELDVPNTTDGKNLVENVRAGVVGGVSFGFSAQKEQVVRGTDMDTRTLTQVRLFEVSPTVVPAYASTSIDFRSHERLCESPAEVRSISIYGDVSEVTNTEPAALPPFTLTGARAARFGLR